MFSSKLSIRPFTMLTALIGCLAALTVNAADFSACQTIHYQPKRSYVINATLNHATHIILPEPMESAPIAGNKDLWEVAGSFGHLFIKPTNEDSVDGASTTVTVIGKSNTSYDFDVHRVAKGGDTCIYISRGDDMVPQSADWRTPDQRQADALSQQVHTLQDQLVASKVDADKRALDTVHEYQAKIYTNYKWDKSSNGFMSKHIIRDVWDDGRFTYIRITEDNKGILQVIAQVDKKDEFIDYNYDESKKMYTLSGLYPSFRLKYGKSEVSIKRLDEKTAG